MRQTEYGKGVTMGVLDELKQQAEGMRAAEAEEAARLAQQEAYYQASLRPVMLTLLSYLDELIKHINYVQPERTLHCPLSPDRETPVTLKQGQYKLLIDSSDTPRQVDIRVAAKLEQPAVYVLENLAAVQQYTEHLEAYGFAYHRQDALNSVHKVDKATFTLEGPLPHGVRVKADAERQNIEILLRNFGRAGVQRHTFSPDKVNDALLDRLGRMLLHDIDTLPVPCAISPEARQQLRDRLKVQQQETSQQQHEQETANIRERLKRSWLNKMQSARERR
jgi:hypothetical protein